MQVAVEKSCSSGHLCLYCCTHNPVPHKRLKMVGMTEKFFSDIVIKEVHEYICCNLNTYAHFCTHTVIHKSTPSFMHLAPDGHYPAPSQINPVCLPESSFNPD